MVSKNNSGLLKNCMMKPDLPADIRKTARLTVSVLLDYL